LKLQKLTMKNFLTHRDTEIDLTRFERRVYCYSGKTGSGKSAILDGIHYALWGTPLNSKRRSKNLCLRTDTADANEETCVSLTFSVEGKEYAIRRNMSASGVTRVKLTMPDGSVIEKAKEVLPIITRLLGVTEAQYDTVSMLEQGAFARFLHASSLEREGLLRDIFNTHSIEEFSTYAVSRAKELQQQVEISASTLTALTGVPSAEFTEWLSNAKTSLKAKKEKKAEYDDKLVELSDKSEALAKKIGELEGKRQAVEQLKQARRNYEDFLNNNPVEKIEEDERRESELNLLLGRLTDASRYLSAYDVWQQGLQRLKQLESQRQQYMQRPEYADIDQIDTLKRRKDALTESKQSHLVDRQRLAQQFSDSSERDRATEELEKETEKRTAIIADIENVVASIAELRQSEAEHRRLIDVSTEIFNELSEVRAEIALFDNPEATAQRLNQLCDSVTKSFISHLATTYTDCPVCAFKKLGANIDTNSAHTRFDLWTHPAVLEAQKFNSGQNLTRYVELKDKEKELANKYAEIDCVNVKASLTAIINSIAEQTANEGKLRKYLSSAEQKIAVAESVIRKFEATYSTHTADTATLLARLEDADTQIERETAEIFSLRGTISMLETLRNQVSILLPQIEELERSTSEQRTLLDSQGCVDLSDVFGDTEVTASSVESLKSVKQKELTSLRERLKRREEQFHQLKVAVETLEKVAPKGDVEQQLSRTKNEQYVIDSEYSKIHAKYTELNTEITSLSADIKRCDKQIPEFVALRETQLEWKYVADLVSGGNPRKVSLESYVLNSRLSQIVDSANLFLQQIYPDRYEIQASLEASTARGRAGLLITLLDIAKGTERYPETFSGGETFILSLALALGLSATTQSVVSNPLYDLFIDEGFGTLDQEALFNVVNALSMLTSTGVTVGVITHVENLVQAIGCGIKVTKNMTGESEVEYL